MEPYIDVYIIVKKWLAKNGYDGLWSEGECGCDFDDFAPCGQLSEHCVAAYKHSDGLMHPDKEVRDD